MSKQLLVKVNGNPYEVEVIDLCGNAASVTVNGKSFEVEFEEVGAPVQQTVAEPVRKAVQPVAAPVKTTPAPVAATAAPAGNGDTICAPMPGVIMDISVKPGDKLKVAQPVCALEAMKMKNIIRSTREGTVASVEVTEGQRVPFGAVIIRFA